MNERLLNDIELLVELFTKGGWRELRVSAAGLEFLISHDLNSGLEGMQREGVASLAPGVTIARVETPTVAPAVEKAAAPTLPPSGKGGAIDPAWHAVTAPNLGTFYRSPKPGSPPFVELGQRVEATTEVCLLEVMKLFTSVSAGVSGAVVRTCAADAELVEGGQVLFYIQQD